MNRRELLKALSMGAVVTASGLWWPGEKLISIPKKIAAHSNMQPFFTFPCTITNMSQYNGRLIVATEDGCMYEMENMINPTVRLIHKGRSIIGQ